jgi:hypothetical protein
MSLCFCDLKVKTNGLEVYPEASSVNRHSGVDVMNTGKAFEENTYLKADYLIAYNY